MKLDKRKFKVSTLTIFRCILYTHILSQKRGKFNEKYEKYLFIRCCEESKSYRLLNIKINKLIIYNGETHLKKPYVKIEEVKNETIITNEVVEDYEDIQNSYCSSPLTPPTSTQQKE